MNGLLKVNVCFIKAKSLAYRSDLRTVCRDNPFQFPSVQPMPKGNAGPIPLPLSNKLLRFPLKKMRAGNIDARVKRRSKGIFNRGGHSESSAAFYSHHGYRKRELTKQMRRACRRGRRRYCQCTSPICENLLDRRAVQCTI